MPNPPRSTNNSLSAGLRSEDISLLSPAPMVVSTAPSGPVAPLAVDSIAEAVVRALGSTLPTIISSIQGSAPSPLPPSVPGTSVGVTPSSSTGSTAVSCDVNVSSMAFGASSGTFTLPAFIPTFSPVLAITDSSSACFVAPITSPFASPSVSSSLPSFDNSGSVPTSEKAFIVGPGHAPVPAKLAKKIIEGQFVELADLLTVNLRAGDQEPQTILEGKLLVSHVKRRQVEIKDILTWTEAFTIFQLVLCASHPLRWLDLTRYKLLIIQTARQYPGLAWLEYDLAFRRDAAASGLTDWSKMNLDLYTFHLRLPASSSLQPGPSSLSGFPQSSSDSPDSHRGGPFCHSWNEGKCQWRYGRCKFRHNCSNCEGEHAKANCPFPRSAGFRSRSPSPGGRRGQY